MPCQCIVVLSFNSFLTLRLTVLPFLNSNVGPQKLALMPPVMVCCPEKICLKVSLTAILKFTRLGYQVSIRHCIAL
ncbi:MAG: hypothetical protein EBQ77_08920 [Sphingobacteriia bacterium]|nr:hypothetical protein [Sphingobacteriia bacterium]